MLALSRFHLYLGGVAFTVQDDHQVITWLKRMKAPAGRLCLCSLTLKSYHYTVEYSRGWTNALSRSPLPLELSDEVPLKQREGERMTIHPLECEEDSTHPCEAVVTSGASGSVEVEWGTVVS